MFWNRFFVYKFFYLVFFYSYSFISCNYSSNPAEISNFVIIFTGLHCSIDGISISVQFFKMIAINYVNFCWFSSYAPISIVTEHGLHWFNHSELSECTRIHPLTGHTHSRQFLSIGALIQYFRVVWDHKKSYTRQVTS